MKEFYFKNLN